VVGCCDSRNPAGSKEATSLTTSSSEDEEDENEALRAFKVDDTFASPLSDVGAIFRTGGGASEVDDVDDEDMPGDDDQGDANDDAENSDGEDAGMQNGGNPHMTNGS